MSRALPLLLVSSVAFGGTTLTWERTRGAEAPAPVSMKCEGGSARFEGAGSDRIILWDGATKTLSLLKPADKTYQQLTEAQMQQMRDRAAAAMEAMKPRLEKMSPEQRAQLEAMMNAGSGQAGEWKFTPTGKKAKVGKWDCEWYDGTRGGLKTQSCMVPWASAPAKKEELECVKSAMSIFQGMLRGAMHDGDATHDDFTKFPGIPVQTVRESSDGTKHSMTLKNVDRGPLPPETFAVPKGYTLVTKPPSPP
jgi:hypothetical protein